ncbi:MAG: ABC transporter ATP-binding protein [Promethearchaeota archaeon]|jgi:ATP-binding cassette subfamily B protein
MGSFGMIMSYWLRSRKDFVLQFSWMLISTIFYITTPVFIGRMVGSLDPNQPVAANVTELLFYFVLILIFASLRYVLNRAARLRGAEVSARAVYYLRSDISNAIYRQSFSYFDKTETGQLISRATSDIEETQMIFSMGLSLTVQSFLQIGGVIIGFLLFSIEMTLVLIIVICCSLALSYYIAKKLRPIFLETRESFGDLTNTIRENIIGAQVVRMFSTQKKEQQKFIENNERFYNASVKSVKFNSIFLPVIVVVTGFMSVITLFFGGLSVINGNMILDSLITLQSYVIAISFPLMMLGQIMLMYIQADAALIRVKEVLDSTPDVQNLPDAIPGDSITGDIKFENVSFGYTPDHRILKNVSFNVEAGKKLAILGTTGSGKSTIISLIPRFYDVNEGVIKIDNKDIQKYIIKDLRSNIGIVSQETFLFDKSISENIAYGKENATENEIIQAAKIANLHEFIISLPRGYKSLVGERGTRLSGGQKQRLTIARALIIKPKILIFDDSTSSVDVETEYKIQNALVEIMKDTTTIIITQRISTIRDADSILILDRGRVVGFGTHDELINQNVLYSQIYETLYQKQKIKVKVEEDSN